MGTPAMQLAKPPAQPPDVANQISAQPDVASALQSSGSPDSSSPLAKNPQGALLVQGEAIEKVLKQMAAMNAKFAPYADRAMTVIKSGIADAVQNPDSQTADSQPSPGETGAEDSSPSSFPG